MNWYDMKNTYCKRCKNYQHKNRNANLDYDCQLANWICLAKHSEYNDNIAPARFEEEDEHGIEIKKKEFERLENIQEAQDKIYNIFTVLGYLVGFVFLLSILGDIFIVFSIIHYGFTTEGATIFSSIKHVVKSHTFIFIFCIIIHILASMISNRDK